MIVVPAGSFTMGSPPSEAGRTPEEGPQHAVRIEKPFALGRTEVTVGEFGRFIRETGRAVAGCYVWDEYRKLELNRSWEDPGFAQSEDHPVACVSWHDATEYAQWLSSRTGQRYRLPSEAEWEYAARAGTFTARSWGESPDGACAYANVADRAGRRLFSDMLMVHDCDDGYGHAAPVASKHANAFGLHDMLGNVWEWTQDCWNASYLGAPTDGSAHFRGDCTERVYRGGSWINAPRSVRSAYRARSSSGNRYHNIGFRLARVLE